MNSEEIRLDTDRSRRINMPEAIYCEGKTTEQCVQAVSEMLHNESFTDAIIATRANPDQYSALLELDPTSAQRSTLSWRHRPTQNSTIGIVSAGTSDLPVANECKVTLKALGHVTFTITDVGVSGLHRLTEALPEIIKADIVVAIAGMEGSMPTVLAGLIPHPIIAVPTSSGYGSSLEGITAFLSMTASCAQGIAVVGIDNGYGAACAAHRASQLKNPDKP